ncbi:MAG TPA: tail fiber domain-containing protein [Kiritimatiellia bacterium]|nr:tail fiber domain-containing protein [Kiritimatiellia bacterium]
MMKYTTQDVRKQKHQPLVLGALLVSSILYPTSLLLAQAPALINYQGRLVDGTNLVNGTVGLSLRLYDAPSGGSLLYEDSNTVSVVDGLYHTFIGDQPVTTNTLARALLSTNVHLETVVDGVPLSPRERLAAVPYALATRDIVLTPLWNKTVFPERNTIRNDEYGFFGATIGGGSMNYIEQAADSVIAGGRNNVISNLANISFIGGGDRNWIGIAAAYSVIGGGLNNRINTGVEYGFIGTGNQNIIDTNALYGAILGGAFNRIGPNVSHGSILGGSFNLVGSNVNIGIAAGSGAETLHNGSFVWADVSSGSPFRTTSNNQFLIRAANGVGIGVAPTNGPRPMLSVRGRGANHEWLGLVETNGVYRWHVNGFSNGLNIAETDVADARIFIRPGGNVGIGTANPTNRLHVVGTVQATAYITTSDRNAKENIAPVSVDEILEKVVALPISTWTFRDEPNGTHLGPMAQDFHAAFGLGSTDTGIMTVDADGVALAAIQALASEVRDQRSDVGGRMAELEEENRVLRERLEALERKLGM